MKQDSEEAREVILEHGLMDEPGTALPVIFWKGIRQGEVE